MHFYIIKELLISRSTVLKMKNAPYTFIYIVNRVVSREIYTTGKNFTLPPAVTAWTNLTSACMYHQTLGKERFISQYRQSGKRNDLERAVPLESQ